MSDLRLNNDLLLQIAEQQVKDSQVLHELKGNLVARVESLESAQRWSKWMTYVVNPALAILMGIAQYFGVKIPVKP